jgi:predicted secreted protein
MKTLHQCLRVVLLVVVGMLISQSTCDAQVLPLDTLVLTETDDGTTANAVVAQAITVNLRGNLSTGFAWLLGSVTGDSVLANGPTSYVVDPGGGVGVGGTFTFPFLASKEGDTVLSFEYRRSGGGTPIQSFAVTIHVTAAPPRLSIKLAEANVVISWPIVNSTNFFLEGASSFEPSQWEALNVLPLSDGTNLTVTLGTGGKSVYFRLHRL